MAGRSHQAWTTHNYVHGANAHDYDEEELVTVARPWYEDDTPRRAEPNHSRFRTSYDDDEETRPYSAFAANNYPPQRQRRQQAAGPSASRVIMIALGLLAVVAAVLFFSAAVAARGESKDLNITIPPQSVRLLAPPAAVAPLQQSAQIADAAAPAASVVEQPAEDGTIVQTNAPKVRDFVTLKEVVARDGPSLDGAPTVDWLTGTALTASGVWAKSAEGLTWWEMTDAAGRHGWAPAMDLRTAQ